MKFHTKESLKQHLSQRNSIPFFVKYQSEYFTLTYTNKDCTKYSYASNSKTIFVVSGQDRKVLSITVQNRG